MPSSKPLDAAGRDFFRLVAQAAFTNPFGVERERLEAKIAGASPARYSVDEWRVRMVRPVSGRIEKLDRAGFSSVDAFPDEDRGMMRTVFLFETYYRYADKFDQLIRDQITAGDDPSPVPFARDVLSALKRRGFPDSQCLRLFSIFHQLRRGYFFISRELIGRSASMRKLRENLWNNGFTPDINRYDTYLWNRLEDFSTLLLGETGTGKGAASSAIGRSGFIPFDEKRGRFVESFTKAFVSINLSQFPESLIESELFGHRKGAFTGAIEAHDGVFARCSPHGAIFLDEIGDVSIPVQIKLLQVLQERVFSPVGSHERRRFRGRIVAATNKSIDDLRRRGLFRDDFFYRLSSDVITLPPLRQRLAEDAGELDEMLQHVVTRLTGDPAPELVALARGVIQKNLGPRYPWPGNVRELEQCVRRILLTDDYRGDAQAAAPDLRKKLLNGIDSGDLDADALLASYCGLLHERHGTYEEVARRTGLDRRTVKKYVRATPLKA